MQIVWKLYLKTDKVAVSWFQWFVQGPFGRTVQLYLRKNILNKGNGAKFNIQVMQRIVIEGRMQRFYSNLPQFLFDWNPATAQWRQLQEGNFSEHINKATAMYKHYI